MEKVLWSIERVAGLAGESKAKSWYEKTRSKELELSMPPLKMKGKRYGIHLSPEKTSDYIANIINKPKKGEFNVGSEYSQGIFAIRYLARLALHKKRWDVITLKPALPRKYIQEFGERTGWWTIVKNDVFFTIVRFNLILTVHDYQVLNVVITELSRKFKLSKDVVNMILKILHYPLIDTMIKGN